MNRRTFNTKFSKALGGAALLSNIPLVSCAFEISENKKSLGIALVGLGQKRRNMGEHLWYYKRKYL